jgi:hypothetical protein
VYLSPEVEQQLTNIMARREGVESALQRMDVEIYDLESDFLKHCVSFGGSLFDGFGLERRTGAHRNPVAVLTPLHSSSHTGGGAAEAVSASGGLPGSPLRTTAPTGEQLRTYQFPTSSFQGSLGGGGSDTSGSSTAPAVFQVGSKGASSPAYHYRIHFFSPSERVFSACSVGALSRVEIAKSTTVDGGSGVMKGVARSTAAAGVSVARAQGGGKRGRRGGGGPTGAFAREPNAPPSRRRRRDTEEDEDANEDVSAADSGVFSHRRRRHTE